MRKQLLLPLIIMAGVLAACRQSTPIEGVGAFTEIECPFDIGIAARRVTCGMVTVPERHGDPDGPTIEVAVAQLRAKAVFPKPDPLVMVEGGPGGSALSSLAPVFATADGAFLYDQRDLVIIEQRGTRYSTPFLDCPGAPSPGISEEGSSDVFDLYGACRADLTTAGIDLAAFNSVENAADIPLVVEVLGYGDYNFMGLSYGTMLAQHLMRDHPEKLRSVIMDSVAPLETSFLPEIGRSGDRAFRLLLGTCEGDAYCSALYPDLEATFFEVVAQFNADPVTVAVEGENGAAYDIVVSGEFLVSYLFESLYNIELIPYLPAYITALANGDTTWITAHGGELLIETTFAEGFFYSVLCAEDGEFEADISIDSAVYPELQAEAEGEWDEFAAACEAWDVPALPVEVNQPTTSDIPTLLMMGAFDPITPPAFGEDVANHLPEAYTVTFPAASHGVIGAGECPFGVMMAFLDDPTSMPDISCTDEMQLRFDHPLAFYELEQRNIESAGVNLPLPVTWEEVEPGVFRPSHAPDSREIRVMAIEADNPQRVTRQYIPTLEPDGWQKYASETADGREWHIFLAQFGRNLLVVSATEERGTSYLLTIFAPETLVGDLADVIYFPALENFEVTE